MNSSSVNENGCPSCGAPMRFDPTTQAMVCDWCGSTRKPGTNAKKESQETISGTNAGEAVISDDGLRIYNCSACNAELIATPVTAASCCPYCGQNLVLTDQVTGQFRPDGVIPFAYDKSALPAMAKQFYKDKTLLPKDFFTKRIEGEIRSVYVPYWLFDCDFAGNFRYNASTSSTVRSGDYLVTTTKHYLLHRQVEMTFAGIPVDASTAIGDDLMESLEPFDMNGYVPFSSDYLAGFAADRFDQGAEESEERAMARMIESADSVTLRRTTGGFDTVSGVKEKVSPKSVKAAYALLPVYLFDVRYRGKNYRFAANGQTGQMVGELPECKAEKRKLFWGTLLGIMGAVALYAFLRIL